jgi:hypothetical protein
MHLIQGLKWRSFNAKIKVLRDTRSAPTQNLVKLPNGPGSLHNQISGFYSSKQPFTNGLTVRQWLSSQTFEQQFKFGQDVISQFGGNP